MHVVMFADQHAETLGGAQVSIRMQRRYLERVGHTVSIVAPRRHGRRSRAAAPEPAYIDLPSVPATIDGEYAFTWTGPRTDAAVERGLAGRPAPDLVHIQADFWAGFLGYRFARRHDLPVVHTMHNRVDVGLRATAPFPGLVLRGLNAWRRLALPGTAPGSDGWAHLRGLAEGADAVTAPSEHFARRLERHGVFPRVDAIWNGMDDEVLDRMLAAPPRRATEVPTFVWVGRMSPEKRLLPFLEAVARAGVQMRVEVIGGGWQFRAARRLVARYGLGESVAFLGGLPYERTLARIAAADALVQTSIGFETQGMTPFEAAALGTPSVMSDPDIAAEVGEGVWHVGAPGRPDPSIDALAAALRRAAADIRAGAAPVPDPTVRDRFRQSASTERMLGVYRRVLGR